MVGCTLSEPPVSSRDCVTDEYLARLVARVVAMGTDFAGLGLIFCDDLEAVPHLPLYPDLRLVPQANVFDLIADCARLSNPRHDGFQLLTPEWDILMMGTFIAPPLDGGVVANARSHGSRFVAAALTSRLPGVQCCITISRQSRTAYRFKNGSHEEVASRSRCFA